MSRRLFVVLSMVGASSLALAACGSSGDSGGSATTGTGSGQVATVEITLSDAGCEPRSIEATAGPTTFVVTNDGTAAVTEFEVKDGDTIIGEVENVIPGADRDFSLTLEAGSYTTYCPGGSDFEQGSLEVADAADAQ